MYVNEAIGRAHSSANNCSNGTSLPQRLRRFLDHDFDANDVFSLTGVGVVEGPLGAYFIGSAVQDFIKSMQAEKAALNPHNVQGGA